MQIVASEQGSDLLLTVKESRIDAAVATRFKDSVREMTENHHARRVVLDLARVEFLDSSGLGAVVGAMKHLGPRRQLDLAGLQPSVDKVFRMTRMDQVFRIYPDVDAALESVAHAS